MRAMLLAFALCIALTCAARAQDDPPLGERGQWLIDGSVGFSMRYRDWEQRPSAGPRLLSTDELSFWLSPTVRLFVAQNLAVGAYLRLGIDRTEREDGIEFDADSFGGGALLAYRVELSTRAFLLPELAVGATYVDRSERVTPTFVFRGGVGLSPELLQALQSQLSAWRPATLLHVGLYLPLAFVVAPRFYAGVGPFARMVYAPDGIATPRGDVWDLTLGIATTFGSWL